MSLLQPTFRYLDSHIRKPQQEEQNHRRPLSIRHLLNEEPLKNNELSPPKNTNKRIELPPINTLLPPSLQTSPTETLHHHHDVWGGNRPVVTLEKAKRKRILPYQYHCLVQCFERTDSPNTELRERLALELNMTKREVQVWFQNRRAKMNKCRMKAINANKT